MYRSAKEKLFLLNSRVVASTIGLVGVASAGIASASGPDLTALTGAVDYSTVGPAILVVAAAVAGVYVIWKGAKMVVGAIKSL